MDGADVKTYAGILAETLKKKERILKMLRDFTRTQGSILNEEEFDDEAFTGCIDEKQQLLLELEECDDGFMKIYPKVREEFKENKQGYRSEIENLQKLIRSCTDLGVDIRTLEEQNNLKFRIKMSDSKQQLRGFKQNNMAAASYYKNMAAQHQTENSYFMDRKK